MSVDVVKVLKSGPGSGAEEIGLDVSGMVVVSDPADDVETIWVVVELIESMFFYEYTLAITWLNNQQKQTTNEAEDLKDWLNERIVGE